MPVTEESTNAKPVRVPPSAEAAPEANGLSAATQHAATKTIASVRIESPAYHLRGHYGRGLTARIGAAREHAGFRVDLHREHVTLGPRRPDFDLMATRGECVAHARGDSVLDAQDSGAIVVGRERRGEMQRRKLGRLDRGLQVHSEIDHVQKKLQRPLILLIAAFRAEC